MRNLLARRAFLSSLAATGFAAGFAPSADAASRMLADEPFVVPAGDDDAALFAAARTRFLFPTSVTYCNTGTLGAIPRDVVDVVVKGLARLEQELPDWRAPPEAPPLP